MRLAALALTVALSVTAAFARAQDVHPPQDIRAEVAAFLARELGPESPQRRYEVNELDPRLRLARCQEPLELSLPGANPRAGSLTVGVRCSGERPWSIFVPARARTLGPVVVLARSVTPGASLTAADVKVEERDLTSAPAGHFPDPAAVLGRTLKRSLAPGQPLTASVVASSLRVRRGERVVLVARLAGVDVRMQGEALRDAAVGETVTVRNLSSQRVVEGRVGSDGSVEVAM
ncbi:MAG: flagellar basal body P-ring formation protein FlgA [Gammaproteobacteria bacterium]|nr:flagellar basal body P-ring formation protein FlgA [Gammaproteobacteria bacterium]